MGQRAGPIGLTPRAVTASAWIWTTLAVASMGRRPWPWQVLKFLFNIYVVGCTSISKWSTLDNTVNQNYVYIIGVEDYGFENAGADFLQSGAIVTITNGQNTDATALVADSVSADAE